MHRVKVKCSFCGKAYFREIGRVNEAKKFDWKQYCSRKCQDQAKVKGIEKVCANPNCNKKVFREPAQLRKSKSGRIFCSTSCAAIVNNQERQAKKEPRLCKTPGCSNIVRSGNLYCSKKCWASNYKKSESEKRKGILNKIRVFYNTQGRIPIKKEKPGLARAAQAIFGTWNKAIEAAGFEPNPVMFAKKYIANDGHKCDSLAEKIIDDWLYARKIKHKRRVPYPGDKSLTADFVVGNNWIEFLGLNGVISRYDELVKKKQILCKKYNLPLIEIYPKDLFPINHLSEIIKKLRKHNIIDSLPSTPTKNE